MGTASVRLLEAIILLYPKLFFTFECRKKAGEKLNVTYYFSIDRINVTYYYNIKKNKTLSKIFETKGELHMGTIVCQTCNCTIEHFEDEKVTRLYSKCKEGECQAVHEDLD